MELTRRYRVNISRSVKGVTTFDCTVEIVDAADPEKVDVDLKPLILAESDALVAELDKRYPPVITEK